MSIKLHKTKNIMKKMHHEPSISMFTMTLCFDNPS